MAWGTEEGLENIGGTDAFTLAWKTCNERLWTTWSLALLQITGSQSPRACWEGKSWKPSPLLHSKICLSGLAWIREDSCMSECRQDAYLCLHLFVPSTVLCSYGYMGLSLHRHRKCIRLAMWGAHLLEKTFMASFCVCLVYGWYRACKHLRLGKPCHVHGLQRASVDRSHSLHSKDVCFIFPESCSL